MTRSAPKFIPLALGLAAMFGWSAAAYALQASAAAPAHAGQPLRATLTGPTEIPGPGDPDGAGLATVAIDAAKSQLCYTVKVENVEGVTMAHIHRAPMGSMGDVVVPFAAPTTGSSEGCVSIKPELAAAILASPSDYYVNVHSQANPAGAVRGQLGK